MFFRQSKLKEEKKEELKNEKLVVDLDVVPSFHFLESARDEMAETPFYMFS